MKAASEYRGARREAAEIAARAEKVPFSHFWRAIQDKSGPKTISRPTEMKQGKYMPKQGEGEKARRLRTMKEIINAA